jgi:hypothetical protein
MSPKVARSCRLPLLKVRSASWRRSEVAIRQALRRILTQSEHCLAVRYRLPFICDDPDVVGLGVDPACCLDKVGDDLS